ncbi:MAG: hypothetical protein U0X74_11155 [Anaerolineales bacterium]
MAANLYYIVTALLCLTWLLGLVVALISWKRSPRISMLVGAGVIFTACSRISDTMFFAINTNPQFLKMLLEMGKTGSFLNRILLYTQPIGQTLAWILILIAFYLLTKQPKQNES